MKKKVLFLVLASFMLAGCGSQPKDLESCKADIADFEYDISDENVDLKEYNGKLKYLYIQPAYEVNGKTYKTNLSDFWLNNDKVKLVIFGNGIKEVNDSVFNSSEVESVYFPKTMQVVYDKTLDYLHSEDEKIQIYYEGTEDEWNSIFAEYERQTVEEAWNSSEDMEEKGSAVGKSLADKLNSMMGSYDDSEFEYHYSVSEDSLESLMK